jgi:hypothetical protein
MGVRNNHVRRGAWVHSGVALLCLATFALGCAATQQVEVKKTGLNLGFREL